MKIRNKLLLIFIAIAAFPILFFALLSYINAKDFLSSAIAKDLDHVSEFKTREIESFFDNTKKDLLIAQGYYNIKKNLPVVSRLSNSKLSSDYIASKNQLDDQLLVLQKIKGFINIILVDTSGNIAYSSDLEHAEKFEHSTGYLSPDVFEKGKKDINFSDPFQESAGPETRRFGILAVAPAYGLNGEWIGEIVFEIDMEPVYSLIQETTGLGETGETLIGKKINNSEVLILNPLRHDKDAALRKKIPIGGPAGIDIQRATQGIFGSGVITDYRGTEVLADWHYIYSLSWGIVTKIDIDEAFTPINNLRNIIFLIIFSEILALLFVIISASKSISDPIKELQEGAEIVAAGNLDHKVGILTEDEIGHLSRAFDKMTSNLKESYLGLEKKVRERTSELQTSETRYRRLFEAAKDGILILNVETGAITDVNPFLINMLGYPIEELLGKRLWEISPFKDIAENKNAFDKLKQQEYVRYEGLPLQSKSGHSMQVEFVSNVYMAGDKQVIQCNIRDITERKKSEKALREKTEELKKFELAVENSDNHIIITDSDGLILYANKAAEEMTGYSKSEILGKKPSLWGKQMDLEFYKNLWHIIKDEKKVFVGEIRNRKKTGEIYFAEAHVIPLINGEGKIKFFVGVERDITKQKRLEKVHVDFLSLASHQLRTPLSGIKWQIETLKKGIIGQFTKKQETYINGIYEANERMIKLVFDMLNVLKLESGDVDFKKENISATSIFNDILAYVGSAAKGKEINIHGLSKNYDVITLETDIKLLRPILENFFSNAVDYSKQGGGNNF